MKRSEINMDEAQRIAYLKKNRTRLHAQLKTDLATNVVTRYEANARLLAMTESIELMELCNRKGMTYRQLMKLIDTATETNRGYEPGNLFT